MSEKIRYGDYAVCKADFDRLHELDTSEAKLKHRLDLAMKTLADLEITDTQNVKLTQRYIDTTYPNSIKHIEEKRNEILSKYQKRIYIPEKLLQKVFVISFLSIASTVIILTIISLIKAAGF